MEEVKVVVGRAVMVVLRWWRKLCWWCYGSEGNSGCGAMEVAEVEVLVMVMLWWWRKRWWLWG